MILDCYTPNEKGNRSPGQFGWDQYVLNAEKPGAGEQLPRKLEPIVPANPCAATETTDP